MIAHRPSAIAAVDTLLFMTEGQMGAYGPRDKVLNQVVSRSKREGSGLEVVRDP